MWITGFIAGNTKALKISLKLLKSACEDGWPSRLIAGFLIFNEWEIEMSDYKKYVCDVCGHIYDEAEGDADSGIAPGTLWADIPDDWTCPECGVDKDDFSLLD